MAIGKIFGETIEALTTGAFAGFFMTWIPKIWESLKGGIAHPVVENWVKTKLTPKGLNEENIFAYTLSESKMKGKKNQFIGVLNQLENDDLAYGTSYVKNFRLIIAIDAIGRGMVEVKNMDKAGKVVSVTNTPDPNYKRPGQSILESLAKECSTDDEMRLFIIATGAMQDAPFGTMDEMLHWVKKTAWPWISAQYEGFRNGIISACDSGEKYYLQRELNMDAFDAQPLWRKIIDPRNWFRRF